MNYLSIIIIIIIIITYLFKIFGPKILGQAVPESAVKSDQLTSQMCCDCMSAENPFTPDGVLIIHWIAHFKHLCDCYCTDQVQPLVSEFGVCAMMLQLLHVLFTSLHIAKQAIWVARALHFSCKTVRPINSWGSRHIDSKWIIHDRHGGSPK